MHGWLPSILLDLGLFGGAPAVGAFGPMRVRASRVVCDGVRASKVLDDEGGG